jgi:hypothetical protein
MGGSGGGGEGSWDQGIVGGCGIKGSWDLGIEAGEKGSGYAVLPS